MTKNISRSDIVETALSLLRSGGLHALRMRAIASQMGIQQSALYWHFDSKQELLSAVANRIVEPIEAPTGSDWASGTSAIAAQLRDEVLRYPDGAELVATAIAFRLGARRPGARFLAQLTDAGLGEDDAEVATSVLINFVLGFATDEQQHKQAADLGAIQPDRSEPGESSTKRFLSGVDLIIAGIRARIADAVR